VIGDLADGPVVERKEDHQQAADSSYCASYEEPPAEPEIAGREPDGEGSEDRPVLGGRSIDHGEYEKRETREGRNPAGIALSERRERWRDRVAEQVTPLHHERETTGCRQDGAFATAGSIADHFRIEWADEVRVVPRRDPFGGSRDATKPRALGPTALATIRRLPGYRSPGDIPTRRAEAAPLTRLAPTQNSPPPSRRVWRGKYRTREFDDHA
jgi:hypothetical protein